MLRRDPVCGREVDALRARAVGIWGGRTYYFCSPEHKAEFARNPAAHGELGPREPTLPGVGPGAGEGRAAAPRSSVPTVPAALLRSALPVASSERPRLLTDPAGVPLAAGAAAPPPAPPRAGGPTAPEPRASAAEPEAAPTPALGIEESGPFAPLDPTPGRWRSMALLGTLLALAAAVFLLLTRR